VGQPHHLRACCPYPRIAEKYIRQHLLGAAEQSSVQQRGAGVGGGTYPWVEGRGSERKARTTPTHRKTLTHRETQRPCVEGES